MDSLHWILSRISWRDVLDIAIVTLVFFWFLVLIYQTRADQVLRGVVLLVVAAAVLASTLQLTVLGWLIVHSVPVLLVAIPVIFQPELRKLLEQLGRTSRFINHPLATLSVPPVDRTIEQIVLACAHLSMQGFGALLVIERRTGLQEWVATGTRVSGEVSAELLETIFFKNTALHDGAVVIQGNQVVAAKCILPLSDNLSSAVHVGTRHRAALGISEQTDAVAVTVSEETGRFAVAHNGHLTILPSSDALREELGKAFFLPRVGAAQGAA